MNVVDVTRIARIRESAFGAMLRATVGCVMLLFIVQAQSAAHAVPFPHIKHVLLFYSGYVRSPLVHERIASTSNLVLYSIAAMHLGMGKVGGGLLKAGTDASGAAAYGKPGDFQQHRGFTVAVVFLLIETALLAVLLLKWRRTGPPTARRSSVEEVVSRYSTGEDVIDKRSALEDLKRAHSELQQLAPRLLYAQEEERKKISRELHDDIGQRLSLLVFNLDLIEHQMPAQEAAIRADIRKILEDLGELVTDVHNMSHQLHSSKLEHLGLPVALNEICRQLSHQHRIAIHLNADPLPDALPEEVTLSFYRVFQEALRNAVKHSHSPQIDVEVSWSGDALRMKIRDFGIGFDPALATHGLGLVTMQERLRMIGGTLRVSSVPGGGTELEAEARVQSPTYSVQKAS